MFEIPEEDVLYLIKDISRFKNRNIKRSVLVDPKPPNYMMTPDNAIPIGSYNAEDLDEGKGMLDPSLLTLIEQIEEIKELEDVRPTLRENFKVRQLLKNSKLI